MLSIKCHCVAILGAVALIGLGSSALAQPAYYSSTTFSQPTGIANDSTVVGFLGSGIGLWNPTNIGEVGIGGVATGLPGISADGRFIGGSSMGVDGRTEIARYDRNTSAWAAYGGAGGFSGTTRSSGWGISGDGNVLVGFGYGTPTGTATFTGIRPISVNTSTSVVTDYSLIPNANSTNRINASNNDGSVVVGVTRETSSILGSFVWNNGVATPLFATGTTYLGAPTEVSGDGFVIGGPGNAATTMMVGGINTQLPYLFEQPALSVNLLDSIVGDNGLAPAANVTIISSNITGISADGNTAVGFFRGNNFLDQQWGFIWNRGTGIQSFDLYLAGLGVTSAADKYLLPSGISPDGRSFTGLQFNRTGSLSFSSFVVTSVPEPTTCFAGLGLLAAAALRRKRRNR